LGRVRGGMGEESQGQRRIEKRNKWKVKQKKKGNGHLTETKGLRKKSLPETKCYS